MPSGEMDGVESQSEKRAHSDNEDDPLSKQSRSREPAPGRPDASPRRRTSLSPRHPPPDGNVPSPTSHFPPDVILISSLDKACVFTHPQKTSDALNSSPFGKYIVEGSCRILGRGAALRFELASGSVASNEFSRSSLENVSTLGSWKVRCWRPQSARGNLTYEVEGCNKSHHKSSLTEFCTKSEAGDHCTVWALLKGIYITAEELFKECDCGICLHDWIWGVCRVCGSTFSSSELRKRYTLEDLQSSTFLHCSQSLCGGKESAEQSVEPFIHLILSLEDAGNSNDFCVELSGDGAKDFFGTPPSFSWTVGDGPMIAKQTAMSFRIAADVSPFRWGLTREGASDAPGKVQVCSTVVRFMNSDVEI